MDKKMFNAHNLFCSILLFTLFPCLFDSNHIIQSSWRDVIFIVIVIDCLYDIWVVHYAHLWLFQISSSIGDNTISMFNFNRY